MPFATLMLAMAASVQSTAPPTTHERRTYDPERVICRNIVRTGTRAAIRTCLTAREWEVIDEHAQEMIREVQRKPIVN